MLNESSGVQLQVKYIRGFKNFGVILKYFSFSISIVFLSFIAGMIFTTSICKTNFYNKELSNLNFIKNELTNIIIGVGAVKWIVKNTFFRFFNQKLKFDYKMNISDMRYIRNEMTKSDIDHLFAFIIVTIFVIAQITIKNLHLH